MAVSFVFSLANPFVICFCQIAACCPEILTRRGNKIHSQSVPPRHPFSAAKVFRQKLDGFLRTLAKIFQHLFFSENFTIER